MKIDLEKAFKQKKVMITGGMGFIGSTLAHKLVSLDANVTIVDSLIPRYGSNLFNINGIENKVHVNVSDVRDEYATMHLVRDVDYLFNLAGQVSHIDSMLDPYTDLEINARSQLSILEALKKNNREARILFAGTRGEYGKVKKLPVDETHPLDPTDVNGVNNIAGESYHILYHRVYGIRASSLRLTNIYGPRHQMKNSVQGYLNWFIRLALDDQTIPIYGTGENLRDFVYVDDAVRAFLLVAAQENTVGEIYNVGSEKGISLLDSGKKVIEACGSGKIEYVPFPEEKAKIEIGSYVTDCTKIKTVTGWEAQVDFEEGLGRTVAFYRKYRSHYW